MARYHDTSKRVRRNEDGNEAEHLCDSKIYGEPWQRALSAYLRHAEQGKPAPEKARQLLAAAVAASRR